MYYIVRVYYFTYLYVHISNSWNKNAFFLIKG